MFSPFLLSINSLYFKKAMIKTEIDNQELLKHLENVKEDSKDIFLLSGGEARLTVVNATHLVNQMRANHKLGLLETYVLGQAYIAGLLLSSTVKGNDRVQLMIECGGPIKGISVEAWAVGAVRGYLLENPIKLAKPLESLDTSPLFGPGFMTVSRILEGSKEPVSGTVMLQYGNIAKDLAVYFDESEQTPTLFYISIHFDRNGNVTGAGGLFIQAMPSCTAALLDSLGEKSKHFTNLGEALSTAVSGRNYVENEFRDYAPQHLADSFVAFSCPCSRKGFENYLANLPQKEKDEILSGTFPLNLECFNCGTVYSFTKSEAETLFMKEKTNDILCTDSGKPE